jgi:hypothetical protein
MTNLTPLPSAVRGMPPLRQAVKLAWSDAAQATAVLSTSFVIAIVANAVGDVIALLSLRGRADDSIGAILVTFLIGVAQVFFMAPYLIAVHRLIVLDEVAPSYWANFGGQRFQHFFGWCVAFIGAASGALLIVRLSPIGDDLAGVVYALIGIALIVFTIRLALIYPAIAVDAPGATAVNALADSHGHGWRIFALAFAAVLPIALAGMVLQALIGWAAETGETTIGGTVVGSAVEVVWLTVVSVIGARLLQWLGNRVRQ